MNTRIASNRKKTHGITRNFVTRLSAALAFGASFFTSSAHAVTFEGNSGATPGDGLSWLDPLNWQGDVLPGALDSAEFGTGILGTINLGGNQSISGLTFNANATLGYYGDRNQISNTGGNVTVNTGVSATINADYAGANALTLSGGGSLLLNNFINSFTGNTVIDGAGTRLTVRSQGPLAYISGIGHVFAGRGDNYALRFGATRTLTVSNGGEFRIVGTGYNPDANTINFVLGAGGGKINVGTASQLFLIDDLAQISGTGAFTKTGNGRLLIASQDYNLAVPSVTVDGGILDLNRPQGNTVGNRFSAFVATATMTINNGGTIALQGGNVLNQATLTLNNGASEVYQGGDAAIGLAAGDSTVNIPAGATVNFINRDGLNNIQQGRAGRINDNVIGSGIANIYAAP